MAGPAVRQPGQARYVVVGQIRGVFGIRGWVRVQSYTRPPENLLAYDPWYLERGAGRWRRIVRGAGNPRGDGLVAEIEGIEDRDRARALLGCRIAVRREQLPEPGPGEYYWCDLIGLRVEDTSGRYLGEIKELRETGANDVLVVDGGSRCLIPFVRGRIVEEIDLERGRVRVAWNPEYI